MARVWGLICCLTRRPYHLGEGIGKDTLRQGQLATDFHRRQKFTWEHASRRSVEIWFYLNIFLILTVPFRFLRTGVQRLPSEDTLYGELDSPRHERSAFADSCWGRDLQFESQRVARNCDRPVVSEANDLDVRHQGCPHVPIWSVYDSAVDASRR